MERFHNRFIPVDEPQKNLDHCTDLLREKQIEICMSLSVKYTSTHPKLEEQLSKYIMRDPSFLGDLNKGILLIGAQGRGKSLLMEAFCTLFSIVHKWPIKSIDAIDIQKAYRRSGVKMQEMEDLISDSHMVYLDDISEEVDIANVYGTKVFIGYEVLSIRHKQWYKRGFLTFATSNSNIEMLGQKYGPRIQSRIHELFNVFALQGDDLRIKKG